MKLLLYVLLITTMIFTSFKQEQDDKSIFQQLNVLQGTWKMETTGGILFESWSKMNDTLMKSRSFVLKEKDTVLLENVSLQHTKGGIFYIPVVKENNMKRVSFKLTSNNNNSFVFENPHHDFPKRIVSQDSLHAYIDGGISNASKRSDYYYKRFE